MMTIRSTIATAIATLLGGSLTMPARAVNLTWFGGNGDFEIAANWGGAVPGAGDLAIINAGTATLANNRSVGALRLGGGNLNGAGNLSAIGLFEFNSGQLGGFGGQVIANGGLAISGTGSKTLGASNGIVSSGIVNNGAGTWSGSGSISNWATGRFTNSAGASFDIQTDADFSGGSFINQGSLVKSVGAGGAAKTEVSALFNNTGSVNAQQGILAFTGGGTHSGSFTSSATGWIEFAGSSSNPTHNLTSGASVSGNARHTSSFGATVVNVGAGYNTTRTEIAPSGIFEVASGAAANTTTLGIFNGTYRGAGNFVASGLVEYTDGQVGGFGGQVIANGGLAISGTGSKTLGASNGIVSSGIVNNGAGTWSGSGSISNWATGRFTNSAGASFDIQTDADFSGGSFINQGSLVKSVGNTQAATVIGAAFSNASTGTVQVQRGVLEVATAFNNQGTINVESGSTFLGSNAFSNAGRINGNGTVRTAVNGTVVNEGVIAPGNSIGALTIDGDLTMSTGKLQFELAGTSSFDRLVIGDAAFFAGTLEVINFGYSPAVGDSFVIITFNQRLSNSVFGSLLVTGYGPEVVFAATYNLNNVTLNVVAVPEPGTWALWLAGLAGIAQVARRRSVGKSSLRGLLSGVGPAVGRTAPLP